MTGIIDIGWIETASCLAVTLLGIDCSNNHAGVTATCTKLLRSVHAAPKHRSVSASHKVTGEPIGVLLNKNRRRPSFHIGSQVRRTCDSGLAKHCV
jgi:hypothetical protein